jgi:regulator of protease activity HflC (stomatin/prohibitin superfamily)
MEKELTLGDVIKVGALALGGVIVLGFGVVASYRYYDVWSMEMQGKAKLAEASQSRQIQVEQARAEKEAAVLRSEAIAIVGKAAKEYPAYSTLAYYSAMADALKEGKIQQMIYIPTEASLPITEAKRH